MQINILSHSPVLPLLVYAFAAVGCLLWVLCAARVEATTSWRRASWLVLGSWAMGGTAIWDMYMLVAIRFGGDGLRFRFALSSILAGIAVAITSAAIGLFLVSVPRRSITRTLLGGATVGAAIAAGNFAALDGLRVNATVSYRPVYAVATVIFAMVTTPVAVAIATRSGRRGSLLWGAAVLTLVVTGTHYLSLASIHIGQSNHAQVVGIKPIGLVIPVAVQLVIRVIVLLMVLQGRDTRQPPETTARALPTDPANVRTRRHERAATTKDAPTLGR